jgi:ACR3 family arsenite efflux pump ArsB
MTIYLIYLLLGLPVILAYATKYKLFSKEPSSSLPSNFGNFIGFALMWHIWIIIFLLGKHK